MSTFEGAVSDFSAVGVSVSNEGQATITRADFEEKLGRLGAELFDRLDPKDRRGEEVTVLNVREARGQLPHARLPGRGKVVRPGRTSGDVTVSEEFLMIPLSDLVEALQASQGDFDWAKAFAPRADLPAARSRLEIKRGPRGRRLAL